MEYEKYTFRSMGFYLYLVFLLLFLDIYCVIFTWKDYSKCLSCYAISFFPHSGKYI